MNMLQTKPTKQREKKKEYQNYAIQCPDGQMFKLIVCVPSAHADSIPVIYRQAFLSLLITVINSMLGSICASTTLM